jgi:hypothetical protein
MRPTRISGRRPSLVLLVYRFLGRPVGDVTSTALPLNIPQARTPKVQVILPTASHSNCVRSMVSAQPSHGSPAPFPAYILDGVSRAVDRGGGEGAPVPRADGAGRVLPQTPSTQRRDQGLPDHSVLALQPRTRCQGQGLPRLTRRLSGQTLGRHELLAEFGMLGKRWTSWPTGRATRWTPPSPRTALIAPYPGSRLRRLGCLH